MQYLHYKPKCKHLSEALKLIKKINRDPAKAPQLIREYEMLYGLTEVLIEAAPTILIQVVMMSGHPRHKILILNPEVTENNRLDIFRKFQRIREPVKKKMWKIPHCV